MFIIQLVDGAAQEYMENTKNAGIPLDDGDLSEVSGGMRPIAEEKNLFDMLFGSYSGGKEQDGKKNGDIDYGKQTY